MGNVVCEGTAVLVAEPTVFIQTPCVIPGQAERIGHASLVATEAVIPFNHTMGHGRLSGDCPHDSQEGHQEQNRDHRPAVAE
jgi:hypothetical protein